MLELPIEKALGVSQSRLALLKKLKIENKELYIEKPRNNVKKIFNITGLDKIFKVEG